MLVYCSTKYSHAYFIEGLILLLTTFSGPMCGLNVCVQLIKCTDNLAWLFYATSAFSFYILP